MLPFDPKKPLFGFSAKFPHAKRRIHLFTDDRFVYFRQKNAPEDWLGTLWGEAHTKILLDRGSYHDAERRIRPLLENGQFFRVLMKGDPLLKEERMWRVLWRPELAYVLPLQPRKGFTGAFFWPRPMQPFSLWKTSTETLRSHFEQEWRDPNSDVREALSWCDLPTGNSRNWRAIKWLHGGQKELETVSCLAFQVEEDWPRAAPLLLNFKAMQPTQVHPEGAFDFSCYFADPVLAQWILPETHRLTNLIKRLKERNQGVFDFPNSNRVTWPLPWVERNPSVSKFRRLHITNTIAPPIQHERLEAALFLREWLQQHATDLLPDWFPNAT